MLFSFTKLRFFLFTLLLLQANILKSQVIAPALDWQKCLGGSGEETLKQLLPTADGGSLILGTTTSSNGDVTGYHGAKDIWVAKLDPSGTIQWQRALGGSADDLPIKIGLLPTGGYLLLGSTQSNNGDVSGYHGGNDSWVVKLSVTGAIDWSRCLGGSQDDFLDDYEITSANNILLAGNSFSNNGDVSGNHGNKDGWMVELNGNGILQWQKCYGGTNNDVIVDIEPVQSGDYVFLANTNSTNGDVSGSPHGNTSVIWGVRINNTGNIVWQQTYSGKNDNPTWQFDQAVKIIYTNRKYILSFTTNSIFTWLYAPYGGIYENVPRFQVIDISNGNTIGDQYKIQGIQGGFDPAISSSMTVMPKFGGGIDVNMKRQHCIISDGYVHYHAGQGYAHLRSLTIPRTPTENAITPRYEMRVQNYRCPSGYFGVTPIVTYGYVLSGGAISYDEQNSFLSGTYNNSTPSNDATKDDGFIAWGNAPGIGYSYDGTGSTMILGGNNQDYLHEMAISDPFRLYSGGFTFSTNGAFSTNHGNRDIWLVKIKLQNNRILGNVYLDTNSDGIRNAGEPLLNNLLVQSEKTGAQISSVTNDGAFKNFTDTGNYVTRIVFPGPHYILNPPQHASTFNTYAQTDSFELGMAPIPNKKDLIVSVVALGRARPGFNITYEVEYQNIGTEPVNGTLLRFIKDSRTSIVSTTFPGYTQNGDTLTWNTSNLAPFDKNRFQVVLNISPPPVVNINDTLHTTGIISPTTGDETPANNQFTNRARVTGSFDPNDKLNQHAGFVTRNYLTNGGYIYYTIRFQNNGNDTAFNVKIQDTLPNDLNGSTLQVLSSSHPVETSIWKNKQVTWKFNNILLPDSATNNSGSQGYISFRVQPFPDSVYSEKKIYNRASIYFDFNESIVTPTDIVEMDVVRVPTTNLAQGYCKNPGGVQTGKLLNPKPQYTVSLWLDQQPLSYSPADSSFTFNTANLLAGSHQLKARYRIGNSDSSEAIVNFSVDSVYTPVILQNDTVVCQQPYGTLLAINSNIPVNWLGPLQSGFSNSTTTYMSLALIPGTYRVIANRLNGTCPSRHDTVYVTIQAPARPNIYNNDTTVCIQSQPVTLLASSQVIWSGNGVSGNQFHPSVSGAGTHRIMATANGGFCQVQNATDSVLITVIQPTPVVILTPNQFICKTAAPFNLVANTPVSWSGPGVTGNLFSPSIAGPGVHNIIATKANGVCPDTKDTLTITVDDFVQAVISTPNQTICKLSAPVSLQANTNVSWAGTGVSGATFNPSVAGAGTHQVIATKTNGSCTDSKDTLTIVVDDFVQAVITTPNQTICKLSAPVSLQANTNVSWVGTGVSGSTFNPAVAGAGSHQIIATKTNGTCPDTKDTLTITVDDFVQAIISTPNQTVCALSSLINLQANTSVSWTGTGVSGSTFNPAVAGVGTHQIIATKNNGTCPNSKDTLVITVDDFVQAVIATPNQTVCALSSLINLQANTTVSWSGTGVSGSTFNPAVAGVGTHQIIATKNNGTCPETKDTLTITVDDFVQAVITTPNQNICKLSSPIALQANTSVSWAGTGVSGSTFNPAVAGAGTHQVIATKTNGACPDSKDTLTITVDDFVQAVISTPNQTICRLSSSIALQANTSVSWAGTGVSGSSFNPSVAGAGTHQIIATKTNGTCPETKDTLTITVDDFVQAVITTPNQTVCISVSPIALQANTNVSWVGTGVSGATFNPSVAGAGTHQVIATKTNGSCPDSKDTLLITVNALLTPDVNLNASQNTINSANSFSDLVATNATGGGTAPLYIFAKDRNFTQVLQAESASNTYRVLPQMLNVGANTLYVRMRSSENCVTSTTAIDSVQLTLLVNTPSKSELEQALKVFPNPNNGQFGFRFETGINDRVLVTVYDAIGKQVFKQDYGQVQQFNFGKTLDLRNRHAGRYTIQFRVGNMVIIRKVNVMR